MDYVLVAGAALAASWATLYSGFGLGTVLLPVFALFFPVEAAVAATGAVHLSHNLLKASLLARRTDWRAAAAFGIPAVLCALPGARLLVALAGLPAFGEWSAGGRSFAVTPVGAAVGLLLLVFALLDVQGPERLSFPRRWMPLGGALSGFFGGLSGHQGALRSAFLVRAGLFKEAFVATGAVIACGVDLARLSVYAALFTSADWGGRAELLAAGVLAAVLGTTLGVRFLGKVSYGAVRRLVGSLLLVLGAGMVLGIL